MMIEQLRMKVETAFTRIEANWKTRLPFGGRFLRAARDMILGNLEAIKAQVESFFNDGDYASGVRAMILFLRGNLRLPILLRPFAGLFLSQLEEWLLRNQDLFRDRIGSSRS